jgi:lipopolysaccharide cholinephosphotransferase
MEHLRQYQEETKFVYIPDVNSKYNGVSTLREVYSDVSEVEFCGYGFWGINRAHEWVMDHYGPNYQESHKLIMANASLLDGPEILRQVQLVELDLLLEFDLICKNNDISYTLGYGTLLGAIRHKGFIPWDDDIDVIMLYEDYLRFLEIAPNELNPNKYFLRWHKTDNDCNLTFAQIKRNDTLFCREGREEYSTHNGIFLDIIPMFNGPNTWIQHKIQHKVCRFLKTMLWAHMGHISEKRKLYKFYYTLLSKVPIEKSYALFMKYATLFKKGRGKLSSLCIFRSPYNNAFTCKNTYEELVEVEFEGCKFMAPQKHHEILKYCYGDYMRYPKMIARAAKHLPNKIEIKWHVQNDVMKRIGELEKR